jgi:ABC-type antimicrobial peptide transport system permease subunit
MLYVNMNADVQAKNLTTLRKEIPGTLVLDLSNFTALINKTIDKMELFPIIIGALALFAGVVIIANTVALAMLERRREIAVMKAVGAKRRTILQFLLAESAVVGFLGAAVGVGLAMIATALVDKMFLEIAAGYDWLTITGLLLLGMVLSMGASALTALPASSERPMTVLRYE